MRRPAWPVLTISDPANRRTGAVRIVPRMGRAGAGVAVLVALRSRRGSAGEPGVSEQSFRLFI
jgi:hypothetical protein